MKDSMMWTNEQMYAITARNSRILVSAAAGAGKTAVLVERIIRMITDPDDPVDIDSLLVVTFTNAAAAEMKERIASSLSEALEKAPGCTDIKRQMILINRAAITTIHSFCLEVIRDNFQHIGIDPDFRIADETEAELLKIEVLDRFFDDIYEEEDPTKKSLYEDLLECYGGNRSDKGIMELVLQVYNFIQSCPWPDEWLAASAGKFSLKFPSLASESDDDFSLTEYGRIIIADILLELGEFKERLAEAIEIIKGPLGPSRYLEVFQEDLSNLSSLTCLEKWDEFYNAFQKYDFGRLPGAGKDSDQTAKDYVRKIRDEVKSGIDRMRSELFHSDSPGIQRGLDRLFPLMGFLGELVSEFGKRYEKKKESRAIADFNDLEHWCLAILSEKGKNGEITPSEIAADYSRKYREILVDEYQDSNLVQEYIIRLIAGRGIFMVGDVKQSIYKFRQARPELFLEKYRSYSDLPSSESRKILLHRNFRSRSEIINAVNLVFSKIMSERAGEIEYNGKEALEAGAIFGDDPVNAAEIKAGGNVEICLVQTQEASDHEDPDETEAAAELKYSPDRIQCEAAVAASIITELKVGGFCIYDRKADRYRKLEYRDIVILMRATKNWAEIYLSELASRGIPVYADIGTGFFKTPEVQVVLSILQIIDNPIQDIPLLSVLRSPVYGFTSDDLADVRLADPKADLYHALLTAAGRQTVKGKLEETDGLFPETGNQLAGKVQKFLDDLDGWRSMAHYLPTDKLVWRLYEDTGYLALVGAMPEGRQKQANLEILFERARQFEETSFKGLFNFITFIDRLKSGKGDMGSARILGENENTVRIMSIHKSKGLEFPVVILAGCGRKFNRQDMAKKVLLHQELGYGPDIIDHVRRITYPSAPKLAILIKSELESVSEEMRILYVAMTRAREKLIITGTVGNAAGALSKWNGMAGRAHNSVEGSLRLLPYDICKAGCYLDWLFPALMAERAGGAVERTSGISPVIRNEYKMPEGWELKVCLKEDIHPAGRSTAGKSDSNNGVPMRLESIMKKLQQEDPGNMATCEVERRLGWEYPFKPLSFIPSKYTVTELKRQYDPLFSGDDMQYKVLRKKPLFMEPIRGLSPAEKGTIMHFVMQHLDFADNDITSQLNKMAERELLTGTQMEEMVNEAQKIRQFLDSDLVLRIRKAKQSFREVPFNLQIPCREILKTGIYDESSAALLPRDIQGDDLILLQGVIDCYFEEGDSLVLVDYKTDSISGVIEEVAVIIRDRYKLQLDYYSRALETLTGKKVKERYIYLFSAGIAIPV